VLGEVPEYNLYYFLTEILSFLRNEDKQELYVDFLEEFH
jgi:hypothetical protein